MLALAGAVGGCQTAAPGTPAPPVSSTTPGSSTTVTWSPPTGDATSTTTGPVGQSSATAPTLPLGSSERALTVGNRIRMYRTYRPAGLPSPAPLVVMLHGGLGSARAAESAYGWDRLADQDGFVVIYPDSVGGGWNVDGQCCGVAPGLGIDDVGFVTAAVLDVSRSVAIDPTRRYAAGMSNGGMLAYRLACDTTLFAGIGAVAATRLGDCPNPAPLSVIHVHGTADTTVPMDGRSDAGVASIIGPPVADVIKEWRQVDRCGGTVERTDGPVTTYTSQCPSNRAVTLVLVQAFGHGWPGVARSGPLDASPSSLPPPSSTSATTSSGAGLSFDATAQVWAFLSTRSK